MSAARGRRRLALLSLCVLVCSAREIGVSLQGSPPDYVANCPGGTYLQRLPMPTAGGGSDVDGELVCTDASSGLGCSGGGPYLFVFGAESAEVSGVYTHVEDPQNTTHQYYTKGDFTLLWEPGPRDVHGLRWMLFGPQGLLYLKYTPDELLGWRGTEAHGAWSIRAGLAPPPLVESEMPEDELTVTAAGTLPARGKYTRIPGASKIYRKGEYWILWQPGPQVATGLRWVLFSSAQRSYLKSSIRTYYYRLSDDSEYGYVGTWTVDWGLYHPPSVSLVQTVACFRCPAGSYSTDGSTACERCPPGFFSLGAADACSSCQVGTFANGGLPTTSYRKLPQCNKPYFGAGRGSCTEVVPGSTGCTTCPPGRFSSAAAGECEACAPGTRNGVPGSGVCTLCLPGRRCRSQHLRNYSRTPQKEAPMRLPGFPHS